MNFLFRLCGVFALLIDKILSPIYYLRRCISWRKVPPIDNQIFLLSATDLATKIRQKKLTSLYVIATYIGRIKQVNPILNAVCSERFDKALIEAKAIDDFLTNTKLSEDELAKLKPFLGVPITIKESCGVQGMSYGVGAMKRKGIKCEQDGPSIKRLKEAGFIPLAVTNCPEFCVGLETINLLYGQTNNPYNVHYTVGGSSGGEAALLGSGASLVGVGSDYAGSIRLPCMYTGVFGHKTTPKIIPRTMHFPNSNDPNSFNYFAIGPMSRYACDLLPMLKIMSGEQGEALRLDEKVDLRHTKVFYTNAYYDLFGIERVSDTIVHRIEVAWKYLHEKCEMQAQCVRFNELENAIEIATSLYLDHSDIPNFLEDPHNPKKTLNLYMEIVKSLCGLSYISIFLLLTVLAIRFNAFIPKSHLPYYRMKMAQLRKNLLDTLGDNGVLLYPTFPTSAFDHYRIFTKSLGISYAMIFNILGCAITQVPIGLDHKGLPIGIQVIAAPNQDRLSIAVAEALEKKFGGWIPPS